jgi:hypothetical protein
MQYQQQNPVGHRIARSAQLPSYYTAFIAGAEWAKLSLGNRQDLERNFFPIFSSA